MDPNKKRPIKLIMNNEEEKDNIMSKLTNLKNAEDKFRRLSITDDYTQDERQSIKEWVEKSKLKNQEESSDSIFIWRVRGTRKNGHRLVRFTKK